MITKQHRGGKSVRKLLDYCLKKDQDPEIIGGTMTGQNARELSKEFAENRAASAHLSHPVLHWSISYQQADIEAGLTHEKRGAIAHDIFRRHLEDDWSKVNAQRLQRGHEPLPKPDADQWDVVVISHRTADAKQNPHDHLVAIRANRDGYVYHAKFSRMAAVEIDRAVERDYSLTPLPTRERQSSRTQTRPTDRPGYIAHQRDQVTVKDTVARDARVVLDALQQDKRTVSGFAQALSERGLCLYQEQSDRGRQRYYLGLVDGERWRADRLGFKGTDAVERLDDSSRQPQRRTPSQRER